jgi:hypothetical protein
MDRCWNARENASAKPAVEKLGCGFLPSSLSVVNE